MPLEKTTDYGKITVSDKVFEDEIARFCQQPKLYDRIWLAQKPNVKCAYDDNERIEIGFSVYVKFGESIKETTKTLSDKLAKLIYDRTGKYPGTVNINVSGVRSQTLVKRNMDLSYDYSEEQDREC